MMRNKKIGIVLLLCALSLSLCACQKQSTTKDESKEVFSIGKTSVGFGEVYIYAETVKESYEVVYGQNVWRIESMDEGGKSTKMEDVVRKDIIDAIISVKLLVDHADEYDVSLTDKEQKRASEQAETFYKSLTDAQKEETDITMETVELVYAENMLADKVYDEIMSTSGIEVSAEEARKTTFYDLCFATYKEDANGNVIPFSEEEKEEQKELCWVASELMSNPDEPLSPQEISQKYGLDADEPRTMRYQDVVAEYGETMADEIYSVKNGEHSEIIESAYGYHIIYMVALTDEVETKNYKDALYDERCKAYYEDIYKQWLTKKDPLWNYALRVNKKLYKEIPFEEGE